MRSFAAESTGKRNNLGNEMELYRGVGVMSRLLQTAFGTGEFHKLAKFLRLGSFRVRHPGSVRRSRCTAAALKVIILQGVFGTIPGAAQTFTTMHPSLHIGRAGSGRAPVWNVRYFQYLSISNHMSPGEMLVRLLLSALELLVEVWTDYRYAHGR